MCISTVAIHRKLLLTFEECSQGTEGGCGICREPSYTTKEHIAAFPNIFPWTLPAPCHVRADIEQHRLLHCSIRTLNINGDVTDGGYVGLQGELR